MAQSNHGTFTGKLGSDGVMSGTIGFGSSPSANQRKQFKLFDKFDKGIKKMAGGSSGMSSIMGAFGSIMGALMDVMLMPVFPELIKWIKLFSEFVKEVRKEGLAKALADLLPKMFELAGQQIAALVEYLKPVWENTILPGLKHVFKWFMDKIAPTLLTVFLIFIALWIAVNILIELAIIAIIAFLPEILLGALVAGALYLLYKLVEWSVPFIVEFAKMLWDAVVGIGKAIWEFLTNLPKILGMFVGALLGLAWAFLTHLPKILGMLVGALLGLAYDLLVKLPIAIFKALVDFIPKLVEWAASLTAAIWDGVVGIVGAVAGAIWDAITALPGLILSGIMALPGLIAKGLAGLGKIISNAVKGIFGWVGDVAGGFASGVGAGWDAVTSVL